MNFSGLTFAPCFNRVTSWLQDHAPAAAVLPCHSAQFGESVETGKRVQNAFFLRIIRCDDVVKNLRNDGFDRRGVRRTPMMDEHRSPLPFATTKLQRNAADGLFTKTSGFLASTFLSVLVLFPDRCNLFPDRVHYLVV